ncbi:MAG: DegT/DnrJ/EryC1/StrS family aminotransferase [Planctomycetales bacterium]|nr:DegT/DnrJ/EryC1/StrS family aminotransferase [Planctomycetales bacterium]
MDTRPKSTVPETAAASSAVPMLDVNRQNQQLRDQIGAAIDEVCQSGAFVHGPACQEFEAAMAAYCGTKHAVGCASGSDALLLALMALGVGPGDEVVLPSFTFFATAGAVWRLGAKPVFADILPDTFNLDPAEVERKISGSTKAIIPVHLFGQCCDMNRLGELAQANGIPLIEDAAQAIGAEFEGKRAGSLGKLGCFSFYPTKNLGGFGDGGIITTDDEEVADSLRVLRDHGQQPRYHHALVGINSRLDSLQAAVLSVKLSKLEEWTAGRQRHAAKYATEFADLKLAAQLVTPTVPVGYRSVWNQYTVRVRDGRRGEFQRYLAGRQIGSAVYYPIPLHMQKCFAELGAKRGSLPVSEQAAEEVLSLPIYAEMTVAEQDCVIRAVAEFFGAEAARDTKQLAA